MRSATPTKKPTCADHGREHTWESRGRRGRHGMLLFQCTTCTAWGWAAPNTTMPVQAYANPFVDRLRHCWPRPEPTVLTQELRKADTSPALSRWVDRRGDLPPVKSGPTWYTPRYGLSDSERVPVGGRRLRIRGGGE